MRKVNIGAGLGFLVFSAVYYFYLIPTQIELASGVGNYTGILTPDYFPRIAIMCFATFSAVLVWQSVRSIEDHPVFENVADRPLLQVAFVFVIGVIYIVALVYLGYSISTPFFLIALMVFYATRTLEIFDSEIRRTMAAMGLANLSSVTRDHIRLPNELPVSGQG